MDDMINQFDKVAAFPTRFHLLDSDPFFESLGRNAVKLDFTENKENYTLMAEVPGMKKVCS
jgi:HSP20 family molecular chaperone IbpA